MTLLFSFMRLLARHGRLILVLGLICGIVLPGLAVFLKSYLPELVGLLLFVAALRIGPREAMGKMKDVGSTVFVTALYQVLFPVLAVVIFTQFGWSGPTAFAIILTLAAPSISGGANLTLMTGNDAAAALRLLIVGTALLPVTVLPIFWVLPQLGTPEAVFSASARLFVIIGLAAAAAFAIRQFLLTKPHADDLAVMDGLAALVMAIVVVGLMSELGPALRETPLLALQTLMIVCSINFGLQVVMWFAQGLWKGPGRHTQKDRAAFSIISGNRNMALFLTALPAGVTDPILLYIACYQVPMYLTPLALGWLYKRRT